jgi:hypothetical protein
VQRTLFDDDHDAYRSSVREFLARHARPHVEQYIEDKAIPREIWIEAGKQDLLGLEIPEEFGGVGADDYRFNAVLGEELSAVSAAFSSCFGIHYDVCAPYLVDLTTQEQKERWLPRFCSGELVTAIGMTEPSGGSDLAALKSTAVRDGADWILNGSKTFITNGYSADLVIVAARTSPEKKSKGITLFAVEAGMPGFERGRKLDKVGQTESDTAELFFEDVRLGAEQVIGEVDRGFIAMMERLPQERLGSAVSNLAHAATDPHRDDPVRQGPQGVRLVDRVLPAQQVPARRSGHPDRGHAGVRRPGDPGPQRRHADRGRRGQGEVVERPGAERRPRPLRPAARRLRLHERVPRRACLARRPRDQDLGRLQRDHEGAHRPRPRPVTASVRLLRKV